MDVASEPGPVAMSITLKCQFCASWNRVDTARELHFPAFVRAREPKELDDVQQLAAPGSSRFRSNARGRSGPSMRVQPTGGCARYRCA